MQKLPKVTVSIVVGSMVFNCSGLVCPAFSQDPETVFGTGKATVPASKAKILAPGGQVVRAKVAVPASAPKAAVARAAGPAALIPKHAASSHEVGSATAAASLSPKRQRVRAPAASPTQVRAYCSKLWNKIQNNWELASGKNHVIVSIDVDAAGNVFSTKVTSQPQNADAEAKAQAAVTKSLPLEALPTGLPSAHLTVTFDSTADPHGDASSNGSVRLEYHPGANPGVATGADPERKESDKFEKSDKSDTADSGARAGAAAPTK